jgi:hypothetical protein
MSYSATQLAWAAFASQSNLAATRRITLLALAECHNGQTGQCNPSIQRLVAMTGMKPQTVIDAIKELENTGLITAHRAVGACTSYRLTIAENGNTENGNTEKGTSAENGNAPMPKTATLPLPKTAYKPGIEPGKNQEVTVNARASQTDDKQPAGASAGGEGPHHGESAKPNSRAKPKRRIADDWQPSEQCLSVLEQGGITRAFALSLVGEFRIFWIDTGTLRASWDATFINRAKTLWQQQPGSTHATHQRPDNSAPAKIARAIAERNARQQPTGLGDAQDNIIELRQADYRAVAH